MKEGEATVLKGENRHEARCQNDFRTGTQKRERSLDLQPLAMTLKLNDIISAGTGQFH